MSIARVGTEKSLSSSRKPTNAWVTFTGCYLGSAISVRMCPLTGERQSESVDGPINEENEASKASEIVTERQIGRNGVNTD